MQSAAQIPFSSYQLPLHHLDHSPDPHPECRDHVPACSTVAIKTHSGPRQHFTPALRPFTPPAKNVLAALFQTHWYIIKKARTNRVRAKQETSPMSRPDPHIRANRLSRQAAGYLGKARAFKYLGRLGLIRAELCAPEHIAHLVMMARKTQHTALLYRQLK